MSAKEKRELEAGLRASIARWFEERALLEWLYQTE